MDAIEPSEAGPEQARPRIVLIHALAQSVAPIHDAFRTAWPEARTYDLLETALSADLAAAGGRLGQDIIDRFAWLTGYAQRSAPEGDPTQGVLFTCSAFGPAIDAARAGAAIPILKPNELAFRQAVETGANICLMATFEPAIAPMLAELRDLQASLGRKVSISGHVVPGALAALQAGDAEGHDQMIAAAAANSGQADTLIFGQFSMARAAALAREQAPGKQVLTTPESAVAGLRDLVTRGAAATAG